MKDDTGSRGSRAGKQPVFIRIIAPDIAPDWVKEQAEIYTRVMQDIQQRRRQLERLPTDATRH